jgi:hypothetical protein
MQTQANTRNEQHLGPTTTTYSAVDDVQEDIEIHWRLELVFMNNKVAKGSAAVCLMLTLPPSFPTPHLV